MGKGSRKSCIDIGSSIFLGFCILLLLLAFKAIFIDPSINETQTRVDMGNEIVSKIRKFQTENHRLPKNFVEIGIKEPELSIFGYKKVYANDFEISYEPYFGEINIFSSQSDMWTER
jgi:predicted RND superfamily exporter protein